MVDAKDCCFDDTFVIIDHNGKSSAPIITKNSLFTFLNGAINTTIRDVGMDDYILKNFKSKKYKELISEYERLFNEGKMYKKEYISSAYEYFEMFLGKSTILCKKDDVLANVLIDGKEDSVGTVCELYGEDEEGENPQYEFLTGFIKHVKSKRMVLERKGN